MTAPSADVELPLEVADFLTWLSAEQGRSANTIAAYRRDLVGYLGSLGSPPDLGDVTPDDIRRHLEALRGAGRAPSSIARALVAVRSLHRFLADEGYLPTDPAADVEAPRRPRGLPKALTETEVERLLTSVVGTEPADRRDRAVLEVLYGTGIRISELVGLSLADVDLEGRLLRAFGKGAKERLVPLGSVATRALDDWLDEAGRSEIVGDRPRSRDDAEAVFVNLRGGRLSRQGAWGIVRKYGGRAGLEDRLSPHVLRHSCATHMIDHGADIRAVQELLGHASVSTTQVYTLVSTERLWQVYRSAHPRAESRQIR